MVQELRFAHLADLHLGGWREKRMTELNFSTFQQAITKVIEAQVDFCLFAGDIFNNAVPPLDIVNAAVKEFMRLQEAGIPLYVIGGSHDYSNTGKSFIQLLDRAGVFQDVGKFEHVDKETVNLQFTYDTDSPVRLGGILGRKNGLDKKQYQQLQRASLDDGHCNIFFFHATLNDFKPEFMRQVETEVTSSYLPKGFDYYAGGHVHTPMIGTYDRGTISYPGPLFPNNFSELIREEPGFNLCSFSFSDRSVSVERQVLRTYATEHVSCSFQSVGPLDAKERIEEALKKRDMTDKVVLLELEGIIDGKVSDIQLSSIISQCYEKGAYHVLKNTYKLTSAEVAQPEVKGGEQAQDIEEEVMREHLREAKQPEASYDLLKSLLSLELGKREGEKNAQYEDRVKEALEQTFTRQEVRYDGTAEEQR